MRRVISLWLPHFATDRLRLRQRADGGAAPFPLTPPARGGGKKRGRSGVDRDRHPLVTTVALGGRSLVAAVDVRAAAAGIAPGMPLADARALAPDLATRLADPAGDGAALERLADWCRRYTPLAAVDAAADGGVSGAGLWLDITGCAHLFGGEAALMADLLARLRRFGYGARAGLADTPGAAWAAARFLKEADERKTGGGPLIAPGAARAALAPLPVAALRLAPAAAAGLDRLGLRRVGDLYPLPRATLARRFGDAALRRLDQALGRAPEPISPRAAQEPHLARLVLAEPVLHPEGLAAGLAHLLARLARDLDAAQAGARRLVLTLYRVDGSLRRAAIGTSRPNRDPAALGRLFAEHLDRLDPGFGVEVMALEATTVEPLTALQLAIGRDGRHHPPPQPSPTRGEGEAGTGDSFPLPLREGAGGGGGSFSSPVLAELIDRLGNRFGFDRVTRAMPRESHLPERAARRVPITSEGGASQGGAGRGPRGAWPAMASARPLRLFDAPEPVQATALLPDHPPALFRRGPVLHRVARAEGPERLLPEWWHVGVPDAALPAGRDYFRVEDGEGRRYWLYRELRDGADETLPRWFLHGLFG